MQNHKYIFLMEGVGSSIYFFRAIRPTWCPICQVVVSVGDEVCGELPPLYHRPGTTIPNEEARIAVHLLGSPKFHDVSH